MSRCFPYPPPGYCRNGAEYEALIKSIKLQKEAEKAKAERKKEKKAKKEKKEKKKKEKINDAEKAKLQKYPTEYQQDSLELLPKAADSKEAHNVEAAMPTGELFEKSDLTEEHGRPISSSHKPSYSSDSTQNSNKRKRDDAVLPDVSTVHGKPIKIRLLKKHKVSDSSKETLCSNSGRTDPSSVSGADGRLNNVSLAPSSPYSDRTLVSVRKSGVPATLGRENNAVPGVLLSQTESGQSSLRPGTRINDPHLLHLSKNQPAPIARPILPNTDIPVPSSSKNHDVDMLQSRRQQPVASFGKPVPPQSRLEHEIPSSSKMLHPAPSSTKIDVQRLQSGRQQQASRHPKHGPSDPVFAVGKRATSEVPVPTAGPQKKTEEPHKVKLTKTEKKMQKKHAKYEKMIGSWVPPVFQAMLPDIDDDDEDWLSRRTKTVRPSFSKDEMETCRDSAAMSWQPCARFLADGDIHALPYTVPF